MKFKYLAILNQSNIFMQKLPERASVQTRTVTLLSEQFLLRSRTTLLYFYFYFAAQRSTRGLFTLYRSLSMTLRFTIWYSVNIAFDNPEVLIHRVKAK